MPPKEGILSKISSLFSKQPPPKTPIKGFGVRIKNVIKYHWRGLLGVIPVVIIFIIFLEKEDNAKKTILMWVTMVWWFLVRPINIPATGLIPIFYSPMFGVIQSTKICSCYMNENIMLFILTSILVLLLNNSGADRRIILSFMASGDSSQYSAPKMVYKCSIAAFFMSIFSNRLITTSTVTEYFTTAIMAAEGAAKQDEADLKNVRYVVANAIQTSSAIGSLALIHSAYPTLTFRAIFLENIPPNSIYPDLYNYLQFSAFTVPVVTIMFVLNLAYHMFLAKKAGGKPMSKSSMEIVQKHILDQKKLIPKDVSLHEKESMFFAIVFIVLHIFRWSDWLGGWATFRKEKSANVSAISDATCAAILVVLTHSLPSSLKFLKYFTASKKSELPPPKMESGILWWKFVDKNLNYGYFFLIGSGVAIMKMANHTKLNEQISAGIGSNITSLGWNAGILVIVIISAMLGNIISGTAACVSFLPFVLSAVSKAEDPWVGRSYLAAIAVGMASSFGFIYPYLYTPAYYCHYVGKVPVKKMISNSLISLIICVIILWLALLYYAPVIWDPNGTGIYIVAGESTAPGDASSSTTTTTAAPPS